MENTHRHKHPVVILCGFMGTGKTETGHVLARNLGVRFVDTDAIIEERAGKSVAEIFETDGEARFREYEREVCAALDPGDEGAVIATGGGMIVDETNFARLESLGKMVLLEASIESIAHRTSHSDVRPLLKTGDDALHRVETMLAERDAAYKRVTLVLDTTCRSPEETAHDIEELLRSEGGLTCLRVDTKPLPGAPPGPTNTRISRIVCERGVSIQLGDWIERLGLGTRVFVFIPEVVERLHGATIRSSLGDIAHETIPVDDGDGEKTLQQVERLLDTLAGKGAQRDSVIVACGGGVVGDVAGFVASVYMRGLPLVQVPTTLLAQVDASIGGKTGVNTPRAKNLIGSIYQPHLVLCDTELLATLPQRQIANGMAEVVKTAMLGSSALFAFLEEKPSDLFTAEILERCVRECVAVKGRIVERDPHERDLRRVLNLGHTTAHALEKSHAYAGLLHGEAVSIGLVTALRVGVARGETVRSYYDRVCRILAACGLPLQASRLNEAAVRSALGLDKKRRDGKLTFVLPIQPGQVEIVDDVDTDELIAQMRAEPMG